MPRSIGARLLAANQRPRAGATFVVPNAPDMRIAARGARLHGNAALLGEVVAAVALGRGGAVALGLLGAAAAAGIAGSTLTLLAIADACARRRGRVEKARPSLGRRRGSFAACAPARHREPCCQRGVRPTAAGYLRACHVPMIPASRARRWVWPTRFAIVPRRIERAAQPGRDTFQVA